MQKNAEAQARYRQALATRLKRIEAALEDLPAVIVAALAEQRQSKEGRPDVGTN